MSKHKKSKPSFSSPQILEFFVDFTILARKYDTETLAKMLGITKQAINYHVGKKKTK